MSVSSIRFIHWANVFFEHLLCASPEVARAFSSQPINKSSVLFFSGEALGAIGDLEVLEILKQYSTDPVVEVTWPGPPFPAPACTNL